MMPIAAFKRQRMSAHLLEKVLFKRTNGGRF